MTRAEVLAALVDAAMRGVLDPGALTRRGSVGEGREYAEPMNAWQRRALHIALDAALAAQEGDANVCTCASGRGVRDCPQHAHEGDQGERPPTEPTAEPCGECEDGCVHGTVTPCPHCRGRLLVPTAEPRRTISHVEEPDHPVYADPTAERAGDADEVAAAAGRLIASRLSWGTHSDRWANPAWQREFWTEAAQIALAAQPAAAPDPAETLRAAIEVLVRETLATSPPKSSSQIDAGIRAADRAWAQAVRAVLGDPSGALAEHDAKVLRDAAQDIDAPPGVRRELQARADRLAATTGSTPQPQPGAPE